jgi:hypothetical protein
MTVDVTSAELAGVASLIAPEYRDLPENSERILRVRIALDERGVAELPGFLTDEARELLRRQVLDQERNATSSTEGKNQKFALKGESIRDTVVGELARSAYLLKVVNALLGDVHDRPALVNPPIAQEEIIPGVNIMRGPGDVTAFHFDGSYLNLIFPVVIPAIEGPRRGQLVIYPNARTFDRSRWNTIVIPAIARSAALRRLWRRLEIDYREDTVYAFYGYRSLHGVESPAQAGLRCITNMTVGAPRFSRAPAGTAR